MVSPPHGWVGWEEHWVHLGPLAACPLPAFSFDQVSLLHQSFSLEVREALWVRLLVLYPHLRQPFDIHDFNDYPKTDAKTLYAFSCVLSSWQLCLSSHVLVKTIFNLLNLVFLPLPNAPPYFSYTSYANSDVLLILSFPYLMTMTDTLAQFCSLPQVCLQLLPHLSTLLSSKKVERFAPRT